MSNSRSMKTSIEKLSILMPVFSETKSVPALVSRLQELMGARIHEVVLLLSPRSTEECREICQQLAVEKSFVRIQVQQRIPGIGWAYREGFQSATGSHILMIDSDGEMPAETVPLMIEKMEATGCDVVVASRWMRGGGTQGYGPVKYFLNRGFQYLFRVLFWTSVHDLTLGFKLMTAQVAKTMPWHGQLHEFAAETTLRPIRAGFQVEEVPTVWTKRREGVSKNPFLRNFRYVSLALRVFCSSDKAKRA